VGTCLVEVYGFIVHVLIRIEQDSIVGRETGDNRGAGLRVQPSHYGLRPANHWRKRLWTLHREDGNQIEKSPRCGEMNRSAQFREGDAARQG